MARVGATLFILAATLATSAAANGRGGAGPVEREIGYARTALGYEALIQGDYITAESQIEARRGIAENDPARLLNLAHVHWQTGRIASARAMFESVRNHRRHFAVELANGSVRDSREVATMALERMNQTVAMR
jgi:Tfp pilus assembly protein PilF